MKLSYTGGLVLRLYIVILEGDDLHFLSDTLFEKGSCYYGGLLHCGVKWKLGKGRSKPHEVEINGTRPIYSPSSKYNSPRQPRNATVPVGGSELRFRSAGSMSNSRFGAERFWFRQ